MRPLAHRAAPPHNPRMDPDALADAIRSGDRRALARAVTLTESARPDHRDAAAAILGALKGPLAIRLGLSGAPGVGKSTLIEALGTRLTARGMRVAVLAVDPSSARTGGSILGDKTRMGRLARDPRAFVRPSPAGGELGGVAARTRDAVALMEGAGFDLVIVETVGVGQSETAVASMTDLFALLIAPAGGDELQGVKRGVMEVADAVIVTKADGDLAARAARTQADHAGALRLMRPRPGDPDGVPFAMRLSAETGEGLEAAWDALAALHAHRAATGALGRTRAAQARAAFEAELRRMLLARALAEPGLAARAAALGARVEAGALAPSAAARALLA